MQMRIFCGKGGVGKTTSAVSTALFLASQGQRTAIVDYDGGHSVKSTLGISGELSANVIHHGVCENLGIAIVENTAFASVALSKERGDSFDAYLEQFPGDLGIIPLADMVNAFFGVPTDVPNLQKFMTLVRVLLDLEEAGYSNVTIDVEPTAGLERLLSNADSTARSIRNLQKQGALSLLAIGAKWPDIAKYLKGEYIKSADRYSVRIERAVAMITGAVYLLVCIPEASPVGQALEVRGIIEKFGGLVRGCVVNNIRGEDYEEGNITRLAYAGMQIVRVKRRGQLHDAGSERSDMLLEIGEEIAQGLRF